MSLLTGRGFLFSGVRQVLIGAAAAVVTFAVGSLIGVGGRVSARRTWRTGCGRRASTPGAWSNGPGDRYGAHDHDYDKVIVVERGSIRFGLSLPASPSSSRPAIGSSCRPGRATTRSSGRAASRASRRTCRAGAFDAVARRVAGEW